MSTIDNLFAVASPSESIAIEPLESRAAVIWLNRPERLNALGMEMAEALQQVVVNLLKAGATALVLRARGRGFCAGADLKERRTMAEGDRYAHNRAINAAINEVAAANVPTVAAINGVAMGGGLELALACDIRIAAQTARIGLTEARVGAIPGGGGTQRLPRLIGISRALEMMYSGEPVTAQRAAEIGLVNACVADNELDDAVARLVGLLGSRSRSATATLKQVVYRGMELSLADGLECERQALGTIFGSADYAEGLAAFAERRPPAFAQ